MSIISTDDLIEQRKLILKALDNKVKVSNKELAFYGLTSYLDSESFCSSFYEKMIFYENSKRIIKHDRIKNKEIYFFPKQQEAYDLICKSKRLIICAPTSFGKTLLVKEFIYRNQPKRVVFIVPTNSLAYELETSFKSNKNFANYIIFDRHKRNLPTDNDQFIFIGTQEKFLEIDPEYKKNINLFVIDEAYKFKDDIGKQRTYKLSEAFLSFVNTESDKILLLSPNAEFRGFEKFQFQTFKTNFNAVDHLFHATKTIENFFSTLEDKAKTEKTILYFSSPHLIGEYALSIREEGHLTSKLIQNLEEDFHPEWSVVKLLKLGILVHHGMMPKYIQNKIINLFNHDENYKLLVGTNSISEGINTPTKNIFISPETDLKKDILLIKNTIGRAGRLGEYPIGHIYTVTDISKIDEDKIVVDLSKNDNEKLDEVSDSKNIEKIRNVAISTGLSFEICKEIIESYHISLNRLKKMISALKENLLRPYLNFMPHLAKKVFTEDYQYIHMIEDETSIQALFYNGYYAMNPVVKNNKIYTSIRTYNEKIEYFKNKIYNPNDVDYDTSRVIECFMRFLYSSCEYYMVPIANIAMLISEKSPEFVFGDNVIECIKCFRKFYNRYISEDINIDDLTDDEKMVLFSLREYGISISKNNINKNVLAEIVENLSSRYTDYDIRIAIKKLANSTSNYKDLYKTLIEKYYD